MTGNCDHHPGDEWLCLSCQREKVAELKAALSAAESVVEASQNLHPSAPTFEDERISYVEVQIEKQSLAEFRTALTAYNALKEDIP